MTWGAAISAGLSLTGSLLNGAAQRGAYKAQRIVDEANARVQNLLGQTNADAANATRTANNGFAVAQAGLSNFMRSLANQGKLRAGGEAVNALNTNLARLQDQAVTGSLNQQITAAEQLGAVRAAAAASGAGGTSAAMLHQTMQLAQARSQTTRDQNVQHQTYDMLAQRAGLVSNMALAVDQGTSFAPIDYGISTAPLAQAPWRAAPPSWQMNAFQTLAPLAGSAVGNAIAGGGTGPAGATFPVQIPAQLEQFLLS